MAGRLFAPSPPIQQTKVSLYLRQLTENIMLKHVSGPLLLPYAPLLVQRPQSHPMMPSLSTSLFGLLDELKYRLLQLWLRVQDGGILSVGAILGLIVLYTARYLASPYRKLPPGPRGYPIIGNLLELGGGQWLKFSEWQKKYGQFATYSFCPYLSSSLPGDIIYLNAAGQPVIIINSPKAGVALLDRRAAIYSDRPRNIVASDIMSDGLSFAFSRYGDT